MDVDGWMNGQGLVDPWECMQGKLELRLTVCGTAQENKHLSGSSSSSLYSELQASWASYKSS